MPIRKLKKKTVLSGNCTVEEAEEIFQWLIGNSKSELDMTGVTHLHAAAFQAIVASGVRVTTLPDDRFSAQALQRLTGGPAKL
ncbi:hypothetical protein [Rhizobium sp. G21]|uniref:hypothetical protein n=1 Tax=Rhizobium sp. G21 TaxID=2758439 RepID=UPI0016031822|nr:hypothetical protein [Rhizobium sp. G21]MBB1251410.1 hypothetical protein [Rhizobium sp. G21]